MIGMYEKSELSGEFTSSLWRCESCDTFVSIHSPKVVSKATCPTCTTGILKYCGNFDQILGSGWADA